MNPPQMPGRVNLVTDQEQVILDLAEQMNYAGLSAAIFRDISESVCTLSVPAEQATKARGFIQDYFTASSESSKEKDMANFKAIHQVVAPKFISAIEKQKDKSNSAFFFLCAGIALLVVSNTESFQEQKLSFSYVILGIIFLCFGIHTFQKAHELRHAAKEEARLLRKVSSWFFSTYSAEDLDHILASCLGRKTFARLSREELREARLSSIRDYVEREYALSDPAWLGWLSDQIYDRLYEISDHKFFD